MSSIFQKFGSKSPQYNKKYKETLFEKFTIKGGGSSEKKRAHGAFFETNYEFLLYGFFLGLYMNSRLELLPSEKVSFSHQIENWGSKKITDPRKKFEYIQDALFQAAFVKTDIDWLSVEMGDTPVDEAVKKLIQTVEEYANGGFEFLLDKVEERLSIPDEVFFLQLLTDSKKK